LSTKKNIMKRFSTLLGITILVLSFATGFVRAQSCDGTFTLQTRFAAGVGPVSVALGDLDGDGDLDMAVANMYSQDTSVLLNNGDGTFATQVRYAAGNTPTGIALGDLDGDGDLDMAVSNLGQFGVTDGETSVLLNNGDGTFATQTRYAAGNFSAFIALGDLDGDNDLDMVVINYEGDMSVLLNNGDGTFATQTRIPVDVESVALGDLDGDGDLDMAVSNFSLFGVIDGTTSVLLNNGDGTFPTQVRYAAGDTPCSIALGDLDGDGDLDMAVDNRGSNDTSVLLNNGDGTFAPQTSYGTGNDPRSIALGDLDDDGDLDMAVANRFSDDTSVLLNNGDGTFATQISYSVGVDPRSVALGDLDGDGDLDMAVANECDRDISVLLNLCNPDSPCPPDLNNDGALDFFDVSAFLSAFGVSDPAADFNNDGEFDFFDVSAFLGAFGAGCP